MNIGDEQCMHCVTSGGDVRYVDFFYMYTAHVVRHVGTCRTFDTAKVL